MNLRIDMSGVEGVSADNLITVIKLAASIDLAALARAVESIPPETAIEDVASLLGYLTPIFPELAIAKAGLILLALIVHGYETGAIKSADPQNPAMQPASGPENPQT